MSGLKHKVQLQLRRPAWLVISSLVAACGIAAIVTLALGIPVPRIHDEFAYLLGGDTYANGRIVNPAHAHWQHFETFHVLTSPVYLPKYAPGQSLVLALGQLLGHPQIGVCLSTGVAAASLAWMLVAWLPARFTWLAWLVAVIHPGLQLKWGHSYMGGAVAMIGASLLLGALGRARRKITAKQSATAALGIVVLAISRPFEGAVLAVCVVVCLAVILQQSDRLLTGKLFRSVLIPGGTVLMCGAVFVIINNLQVTGRVSQLPYQLYESQYGLTPLFLWQNPKAQQPTYRHEVMHRYYQSEYDRAQAKYSSLLVTLEEKMNSLAELIHFFGGGTQYLLLIGLPLALRRSRYRQAFGMLVPVLVAAVATPWTLTHYAAPAAPLIILIILAGLIEISQVLGFGVTSKTEQPSSAMKAVLLRKPKSSTHSAFTGKASLISSNARLTIACATACCLLMLLHSVTLFRNDQLTNQIRWALRRQEIQEQLSQQPGKHLVLVNYSDGHNPHEEWVYNQADIDNAQVVWARMISPEADAGLLSYFADRRLHVVKADSPSKQERITVQSMPQVYSPLQQRIWQASKQLAIPGQAGVLSSYVR